MFFQTKTKEVIDMRPPLERQEAERLVETYSDLVLRLSYSYLNQTQDAQDICQTVFLKLLERKIRSAGRNILLPICPLSPPGTALRTTGRR